MKLKAHEKSLLLELKIDPETPVFVYGDPTRMGQIMLNLIGNAIKFTPEGSIEISSCHENNMMSVSVLDSGIGIHEDDFDSIFQSFQRLVVA